MPLHIFLSRIVTCPFDQRRINTWYLFFHTVLSLKSLAQPVQFGGRFVYPVGEPACDNTASLCSCKDPLTSAQIQTANPRHGLKRIIKNTDCLKTLCCLRYYFLILTKWLYLVHWYDLHIFHLSFLPSSYFSFILQPITERQPNQFDEKRRYLQEISILDEHLLNPLEEPSLPGTWFRTNSLSLCYKRCSLPISCVNDLSAL